MGLLTLLTMKCGVVESGKYQGNYISAGNDSGKAIQANPVNNQLIFFKGTKEAARVNVADEITSYRIERVAKGVALYLSYRDGSSSKVILLYANDKPDRDFYINTILIPLENFCGR